MPTVVWPGAVSGATAGRARFAQRQQGVASTGTSPVWSGVIAVSASPTTSSTVALRLDWTGIGGTLRRSTVPRPARDDTHGVEAGSVTEGRVIARRGLPLRRNPNPS